MANEPRATRTFEMSPFGTIAFAQTSDGRRLQYMTTHPSGDGQELIVVFESGLGVAHTFWGLVQPEVAERTQTVVYCRAGYGRSDVDFELRTVERMARDLGAVIDAVTAPRPQAKVILVGHSVGAAIIEAYAAQDTSARIAGLVFVDGACTDVASLHGPGYRLALQTYAVVTQALARIGATRWMVGKLVDPVLPAAYAAEAKNYELTTAATQNQARETRGWLQALSAPHIHRPLPDVPVTVLSGDRISRRLPKTHRAILASHRRLASQAPQGRHIVIDSGHNIPLDRPHAITTAIADIIDTLTTLDDKN
ncbi:alpha/beta fold hydrolase [Mycolicibacterium fortuitum]|uniref:alpha/beta fold hydrolase n=1 Tax=Mycolicibacterium fortuitum TaxID=1766 RepID=UPI0009C0D8A0|nr:alpha/beta fold hydrolase [Mycolicibacterium fortuitum]